MRHLVLFTALLLPLSYLMIVHDKLKLVGTEKHSPNSLDPARREVRAAISAQNKTSIQRRHTKYRACDIGEYVSYSRAEIPEKISSSSLLRGTRWAGAPQLMSESMFSLALIRGDSIILGWHSKLQWYLHMQAAVY